MHACVHMYYVCTNIRYVRMLLVYVHCMYLCVCTLVYGDTYVHVSDVYVRTVGGVD